MDDQIFGIAIFAEVAAIVIIWVSLRYAILKRPLSFWNKCFAFLIGLEAGKGVVLLYLHPSLEWWWWTASLPLFEKVTIVVDVLILAGSLIFLFILPFKAWLKKF